MIQTGIYSVIVCSLALLYACYSDWKTRTVANEVWLFMIAAGIPFTIYNFYNYGIPFLTRFSYSLVFTFALAYLIFVLGLFGGADAKSLISIAVLIPTNPYLFNVSLIVDPLPFAITTLANGVIVSASLPIVMFLGNLVLVRPKGLIKNLGLAFIGYPVRIDTLSKAKHKFHRVVHSYEVGDENGSIKRKFIFGGVEIDDELLERLNTYRAQEKIDEDVWVTWGVPYMFLITFGFFIALVYGNLILRIMISLFPL